MSEYSLIRRIWAAIAALVLIVAFFAYQFIYQGSDKSVMSDMKIGQPFDLLDNRFLAKE